MLDQKPGGVIRLAALESGRGLASTTIRRERPGPMTATAGVSYGAMLAYRAGDWLVYPLAGDLCRRGAIEHLEPNAMDVLVILLEQAGEVVPRLELLERIWGARAQTSGDSLTRCISLLRKALGDPHSSPIYIRTVHKRGYRFLQPVSRLDGGMP